MYLFQAPLTVDSAATRANAQSFFSDPTVMLIIMLAVGLLFLVFLVFLLIKIIRGKKSLPEEFQKVVLKILVPKDSLKQEKDKNVNDSQATIKEAIGVAETLFSSIGSLKPQSGFRAFIFGREDHTSFEIVSDDETISFYVATPRYLRQFIEQQVQGQYPQAHIEEVEDYNIFHPQGFALGALLTFTRESYFPIKTYQETESDPLNAMLTALAQLPPEDGAAIQFTIRSAKKGWNEIGRKIASEMRQGKPLKEAKKAISGNPFTGVVSELLSQVTQKDDQLGGQKQHYTLSPLEEEMVKRIETKSSKATLQATVRVVVSAKNRNMAQTYLDNILGGFGQYNIYEYGNSFKKIQPRNQARLIQDFIFRNFTTKGSITVNTEEMASLYHFPLPQTETANIEWLEAKRAPAPLTIPKEGVVLGYNDYRGKKTDIRIMREDRRRHQYIIGKSGSGKSWLLANMARQDIANGEGVCIIDPHGDLVDDVLAAIPKERFEDVIIFDPSDVNYPLGLNLLEYDENYPEQKTFVINEMIKIFDKLYDLKSTGGPMFEQYMRNAMLLIMDDPASGSTLMEISRVLSDEDFRRYKLSKCKNQVVKDFWEKEAEKAGGDAALANMVPYITSKLTQFVSNDVMRPIIGQQKSAFNFRELMDNKKILLVKLSKGKIGELNAHLLGMVIVGKILMSALSRTDVPKSERKDFYLYIDEFQNFTTDSIAIILSEARKYMLNLIIAHQYVGQLVDGGDTEIRDAVFGNVGTMMTFKIGVEDAEIFAKEFAPVFNEYDVINIEQYTAYVKLLVKNATVKPFSMRGYVLEDGYEKNVLDAIAELSRLKYGKPREEVEEEILNRAKNTVAAPKPKSPFDDL